MSETSAHGLLTARPQPAAGGPSVTGRQRLGLGTVRDGWLYVPEAFDPVLPAPLVLALHGAGGDGRQMLDILEPLADRHGLILVAPDSRGVTWDVIRGDYGPDVRFIDRALRQVFERHAVDPAHLAVSGFSDGASYALSIGLINGALFTHVLAFSPGFMAPTQVHDSPRCFILHGTADPVLAVERTSRRIVPQLKAAGFTVEYREFAGGHSVPPAIADAAIDFLLA